MRRTAGAASRQRHIDIDAGRLAIGKKENDVESACLIQP